MGVNHGIDSMLVKLKDISLPDPVTIWPLAIGWYIIVFVICVFFVILVIFLIKQLRKKKYRRTILAELRLKTLYNAKTNSQPTPLLISNFLKSFAVQFYKDHNIAVMHSSQWTDFLQSKSQSFSKTSIAILEQLYAHQSHDAKAIEALSNEALSWLKEVL